MRSLAFFLLIAALPASAFDLRDISSKEAIGGLKGALTQSSSAAVAKLGATNGFLENPRVRIPLPPSLKKAEGFLHRVGLGKQTDDFIKTMNHAAESAVPEARRLFVDAVKKMTVRDAKGILKGGDHAGTDYFRRKTGPVLHDRFLPIVTRATRKVKLTEKYDELARKGRMLGLVKAKDANLEEYVTQKALDGLFLIMADEEKTLRRDPGRAASSVVKKVFSSLLR